MPFDKTVLGNSPVPHKRNDRVDGIRRGVHTYQRPSSVRRGPSDQRCGVLLAQACNTTFEPIVRNDMAALTFARLIWVLQNHIRAETIARANARLVKFQSRIPLASFGAAEKLPRQMDKRFVVPMKSLNAGYNGKYFNEQRGVTYYNFMNNQFAGISSVVIPGTLGESAYLLDGLMEHQVELQPQQLITDTAGDSDIMFDLFWLLGFQFSPRLADLGETRLWQFDSC